MKAMNRRNFLGLCGATAAVAGLAACGNSGSNSDSTTSGASSSSDAGSEATASDVTAYGTTDTLTIGVLVSDATSSEALSFRSYYLDYLANQYNVEFIYSDELTDAAGETTALENFISQGVQGIISLSSFDRPAQIDLCEDAGLYYGVAAGTLTDDEHDEYKGVEHYVGSIGPSLNTEYQTGYDMAEHFIEAGKKSFLIFGGAAAYGTEMHIYRIAGMIAAMAAADSTTNYDGATDKDGIVAAMGGTSLDTSKFASDAYTLDYIDGYNMDDAWWGSIAEKMATPGLEAVLAVGNGADFFGSMVGESGVEVGSVDSFTEDYGKAFEAGQLHWMAGKFNASVAPIFVAVMDAVNGAALRDGDDAFRLDQGYWEADSVDTYNEYLSAVSDATDPVYTKDILDAYVATASNAVSFSDFSDFVGAYTFDEIAAL